MSRCESTSDSRDALITTGNFLEDHQEQVLSRNKAEDRTGIIVDRPSTKNSQVYEVEIAGVPLRLKSSHDEQTVNELVSLIDAKIKEALPLTKTGSIQNASILASLHLAEEYLLLKREAQKELARLETQAKKVLADLESSRPNQAVV